MEEVATFQSTDGRKLFGIVHIPEPPPAGNGVNIGVNLLNPGIKYRVAPHRLNVKLARELCRLGYYVLRFDPEGIGDSEGELREGTPVADIWGSIQSGLFVSDTIAANDFFVERYGIERLVLAGNCGGAITALLTAAKDPRITGLCLADVPVFLWSSEKTFIDTAVPGGQKLAYYVSEYWERIFSLEAWRRFLTMQTDFKALARVIRMTLAEKVSFLTRNASPFGDIDKLCDGKGLNKLFFDSFESVIKNQKPVLFIVAGNDPGREVFETYFRNGYLKEQRISCACRGMVEICLIENANHIYSLTDCQERLFEFILNWVKDRAPVGDSDHQGF